MSAAWDGNEIGNTWRHFALVITTAHYCGCLRLLSIASRYTENLVQAGPEGPERP
jgi:hypothetical protein